MQVSQWLDRCNRKVNYEIAVQRSARVTYLGMEKTIKVEKGAMGEPCGLQEALRGLCVS